MVRPEPVRVAAALAAVGALAAWPGAAGAQQLPEGVSPPMLEQGREIYLNQGFCYTCHGRDGRGMPNLGADLTDSEWQHTDGSYASLLERIRKGVPATASSRGVPMPPSGGAKLTPDQLRAVAAYVWSLRRRGGDGDSDGGASGEARQRGADGDAGGPGPGGHRTPR